MHEVVQAYLNWNSFLKSKKINQCITSTEFKNKEYLVKKKMQQMLCENSNLSHVWHVCVIDYTTGLLMS